MKYFGQIPEGTQIFVVVDEDGKPIIENGWISVAGGGFVSSQYIEPVEEIEEFTGIIYYVEGDKVSSWDLQLGYYYTDSNGKKIYLTQEKMIEKIKNGEIKEIKENEIEKYYIFELTHGIEKNGTKWLPGMQVIAKYSNGGKTIETLDGTEFNLENVKQVEKLVGEEEPTTEPEHERETPNGKETADGIMLDDDYAVEYNNENGNASRGIDINCNGITPTRFRTILGNDSNIKYVILRIGATGRGVFALCDKNNSETSADPYEYVKVCNELGIPYGFYFYSTAITEKEGEDVADMIKEIYKSLPIDEELFKLGIMINVENHDDSRIKSDNREGITDGIISCAKKLRRNGLMDNKCIFYSNKSTCMAGGGDSSVDYARVQSELEDEGITLYAWIADPSVGLTTSAQRRSQFGVDARVVGVQANLDYTQRVDGNGTVTYYEGENSEVDVDYWNNDALRELFGIEIETGDREER